MVTDPVEHRVDRSLFQHRNPYRYVPGPVLLFIPSCDDKRSHSMLRRRVSKPYVEKVSSLFIFRLRHKTSIALSNSQTRQSANAVISTRTIQTGLEATQESWNTESSWSFQLRNRPLSSLGASRTNRAMTLPGWSGRSNFPFGFRPRNFSASLGSMFL